ncbi:MAG: hypothetical protein ACTS27_04315 [Phycisphaerales bacterium]
MIRATTFTAVGALMFAAGAAPAGMMQIDFSNVRMAVQGGAPFTGTDFTGTLSFGVPETDNATADVLLDGETVSVIGVLLAIGEINFVDGEIVDGFFGVAEDTTFNIYITDIAPGGGINTQAGQGFSIDGLTLGGQFGNKGTGPAEPGFTFGGVDVFAAFGARAADETLEGSFFITSFNPDENGLDNRVGLDVFILPTPGTAALAGLAGLAFLRRKR